MAVNKFGEKIYSIPELAKDPKIMSFVRESLRNMFGYIGYNGQLEEILDRTMAAFNRLDVRQRGTKIEYDLPKELLEFYEQINYRERKRKRTESRAKSIFDAVSPCLNGGKILDIGTGNSSVALALHNAGYAISTMDVTDNRCREAKESGMEFTRHGVDESLRYDPGSYDIVMTLAVLHHCDDPVRLLDDTIRTSKNFFIR